MDCDKCGDCGGMCGGNTKRRVVAVRRWVHAVLVVVSHTGALRTPTRDNCALQYERLVRP